MSHTYDLRKDEHEFKARLGYKGLRAAYAIYQDCLKENIKTTCMFKPGPHTSESQPSEDSL